MASVIEADRVLSVHELVEAAASRAEYAAWRFDSVRTFGDEAWCTLPTTENGALPRMNAAGLSRITVGVLGARPVGIEISLSCEVLAWNSLSRRGEKVWVHPKLAWNACT